MMSDFVLTSNSDDTLYGRIAADDFKDINSYSQKFDNLSQDMPSTPILAEESVKPVIGNFRLGEVVTPEQKTKQAELDTLETATLAAHRGENSKSPLVQMALAGATRSNDMQAVNQVLNSSETTFDEEEAIDALNKQIEIELQEQGIAIAEVLFGDYNPGDKLPVTYYQSEKDLPPIGDYDITKGRTYWFFEKEVLFPFGHGLSYTTFEYSKLSTDRESFSTSSNSVLVSVEIKNTGPVKGDEVVQLYLKDVQASVPVPQLQLQGFGRFRLAPGELRRPPDRKRCCG